VAHRFSGMFSKLTDERLSEGKSMRMVCDDDMYWTVVLNADTGRNTRQEAYKLVELIKNGLEVKYMETNHQSFLLQHNKFMFFELGTKDAVFAGAGNFTSSAFESNFENFYLITIPEVTKAFSAQFEKFWNEMATEYDKMPKKNVLP
jgi:HKD family nuclease